MKAMCTGKKLISDEMTCQVPAANKPIRWYDPFVQIMVAREL